MIFSISFRISYCSVIVFSYSDTRSCKLPVCPSYWFRGIAFSSSSESLGSAKLLYFDILLYRVGFASVRTPYMRSLLAFIAGAITSVNFHYFNLFLKSSFLSSGTRPSLVTSALRIVENSSLSFSLPEKNMSGLLNFDSFYLFCMNCAISSSLGGFCAIWVYDSALFSSRFRRVIMSLA